MADTVFRNTSDVAWVQGTVAFENGVSFSAAWSASSNIILQLGVNDMKKNVSGQTIGAQLVNASTGAVFTGEVTVYVTGDAGTQALGSVGSGVCTHEGNGYHTYAPAQAETNYDLIAFTFIGTGAIPATVQVYTSYPQTGDNFAVLTDIHDTDLPAVKTQTQDIHDTLDLVHTDVDTVLADTGELQTNQGNWLTATGFSTLDAAGVRTAVGLTAANLDTQLADIPTVAEFEARTIAAADYVVVTDTIAGVTLCGTCTTNTDMRGTDNAALSSVCTETRLAELDAANIPSTVDAVKAKTDNLPASPAATGAKMDIVDTPNSTAVTAIQSGLATPTNITAGTITTVTNLTNAPTTGDLTSTMKTFMGTIVGTAQTGDSFAIVNGAKGLVDIHDTLDLVHTDVDAVLEDTSTTLDEAIGSVALIVDAMDGNVTTIAATTDLCEDILRNKMEIIEETGATTLYADNSISPLMSNAVTSLNGVTTRTRLV